MPDLIKSPDIWKADIKRWIKEGKITLPNLDRMQEETPDYNLMRTPDFWYFQSIGNKTNSYAVQNFELTDDEMNYLNNLLESVKVLNRPIGKTSATVFGQPAEYFLNIKILP